MNAAPRVAFFADSFHEVNGVALTSRQFEAFARSRQLPFLSVHAGPETKSESEGSVSTLELQRGGTAFPIETDLFFDPLLWRYKQRVIQALDAFKPDLIHVTGPNDLGMLGSYIAHNLKVPLVASWHTNVHEYAARRLEKLLSFIPEKQLRKMSAAAERHALSGTALFYRTARM
ncbi:MAG: glycosyltransferase, partial [Bryobacteraceae bacterium]